ASMVYTIKAAVAQSMREATSRQTKRTMEARAERGLSTGGRCYGYHTVEEEGVKVTRVHEEQAAVVRRAFELYRDGHSSGEIAQLFDAEGVPTPGRAAGGWRHNTI